MKRLGIGLALFALMASGCHKRTPSTAPPPPPPAQLAPEPPVTPLPTPQPPPTLPAPELPPVVSVLEQADNAFNVGNFPAAVRGYENYLQTQPNGDKRDQ